MADWADGFLRLHVDDKDVQKDVQRGLDRVDTRKAGDKAGRQYGASFGGAFTKMLAGPSKKRPGRGAVSVLADDITGIGNVSTVASRRVGILTRSLAALNIATGIGEAAGAALVVTLGAVASMASTAAVAGTAYAAALIPSVMGATAALQAQAKVTAAQNKVYATSKARTQAVTQAQAQYRQELKNLSPPQRAFVAALGQAKTTYMAWGKSLARPVLAPLTQALGVTGPLLHALSPLVREAALAVGDLVVRLESSIRGGDLERWVRDILPSVRPVLVNLGLSVGHVVTGVADLARTFAPIATEMSGGLERWTSDFHDWAKELGGTSGFHAFVAQWRQNWPLVKQGLGEFASIAGNILRNMAAMATPANSRALWQIANPLLAIIERLSRNTQLVTLVLYMLALSKGAGKISSMFTAMKTGWGGLARVLSFLTGGRVQLGMQTAGNTMVVAARQMQVAADTMVTAASRAKWPVATGAGAPVPIGGGKGPAAVTKKGTLAFLGSFFGSALTAAGIAVVATNIIGAAVPQTRAGLRRYETSTPAAVQSFLDFMFGGHIGANSVIQGIRGVLGPAADWGPAEVFHWLGTGQGPNWAAAGRRQGAAMLRGFEGVWASAPTALLLRGLDQMNTVTAARAAAGGRGWALAFTPAVTAALAGIRSAFARTQVQMDIQWQATGQRMARGWGNTIQGINTTSQRIASGFGAAARNMTGQSNSMWAGLLSRAQSATGGIQIAINRVKGKIVSVTVTGKGGGKITATSSVKNAAGYLEFHRAGGLITGAPPGRDRIPSLLEAGELVVPRPMVLAGAVDHLRGLLPGFQAGGLVGAGFPGAVTWAGGKERTMARALEQTFAETLHKAFLDSLMAMATAPGGAWGPTPKGPLQAYAKTLLAHYGWANQWGPFNALVMSESGWNVHATNPTSGAYGIAQALPPSKYASAGADWRTSGYTQLRWMMGYIKSRYGSPAAAWAFHQSHNWYRAGGLVKAGAGRYGRVRGMAGGGILTEPVLGLGRSGQMYSFAERGPEPVGGAGIESRLDRLTAAVEALPPRVAAGMAKAAAGPPHLAVQNARLGAR